MRYSENPQGVRAMACVLAGTSLIIGLSACGGGNGNSNNSSNTGAVFTEDQCD